MTNKEKLAQIFPDGIEWSKDWLESKYYESTSEIPNKWIPVSERLPEPYGQVLRTVKSIGWNGTFSIYVDIGTICPIDTDVIAWMPLPEPYEQRKGEE